MAARCRQDRDSRRVLLKPVPLTKEEFGLVKLHPQIGLRILKRVYGFEHILDQIEMHHENYDGTGYPYGIKGERIPLAARVIRVADAFDAMTTDRSYRPAFSPESAMDAISAGSGTEFDPRCAREFLRFLRRRGLRNLAVPVAGGLLPAEAIPVVA